LRSSRAAERRESVPVSVLRGQVAAPVE